MNAATGQPTTPFQQSLRTYIRAGYPILYVVTPEEDRAIDLLAEVLREPELAQRQPYIWSISRGLCTLDYKPIDARTADPEKILPFLQDFPKPGVFVLEDFHFFIDEKTARAPLVIRQLRDLAAHFKANRKTLILLSPVLKIPPELEKDLTVVDLDMPDEAGLLAVLEDTVAQVKDNPKVSIRLDHGGKETVVKALLGLTRAEAENALAKVLVTMSRLDPEDIGLLLAEKEQTIRKSGILEFYSTPEHLGTIGGLDLLKDWLRQRGQAFSEDARAFGLPNPRGLLLVGVLGCGKSLSAKAVAAEWKMPLLKFDLGKVFGPLVGQAEETMRRARRLAESVAPCILWIDEIEKGLAGSKGDSGDSGVASRVFGDLLTWMEEKKAAVFVIATANATESLPPEFMRKGRFDEIFFIDLPNPAEWAMILAIQLTKHQRDPRDFDLPRHAGQSEGYSGAELEQAVVSALYEAYSEGASTPLTDRHLEKAIVETRPLSESQAEAIGLLRKKAQGRWRPASSPATDAAAWDETQPLPLPPKHKRVFEV